MTRAIGFSGSKLARRRQRIAIGYLDAGRKLNALLHRRQPIAEVDIADRPGERRISATSERWANVQKAFQALLPARALRDAYLPHEIRCGKSGVRVANGTCFYASS